MTGAVGPLITHVDKDCSPKDDVAACGQAVINALAGVSQWMDNSSLPPTLAADLHALNDALGKYVLKTPDNSKVDQAWAKVTADANGS